MDLTIQVNIREYRDYRKYTDEFHDKMIVANNFT